MTLALFGMQAPLIPLSAQTYYARHAINLPSKKSDNVAHSKVVCGTFESHMTAATGSSTSTIPIDNADVANTYITDADALLKSKCEAALGNKPGLCVAISWPRGETTRVTAYANASPEYVNMAASWAAKCELVAQ